MKPVTITIDGPAGSGKGTTARLLAQKLNFNYLDSGAIYRALGLYLVENGFGLDDVRPEWLQEIKIDFNTDNQIMLNEREYESRIRTPEAGVYASKIAGQPIVRSCVIPAGQEIVKKGNYVLEGRDTGTVWAPEADVKIYLIADPAVRAHRRWLELTSKGETTSEADILTQIIQRDERDMTRTDGPLKKPEGAYEIDTTDLTIPEQVEKIYTIVQEKITH